MQSGLSPPKETHGKAQAMLYVAFVAAKGDAGGLEPSWRTIQITVYAVSGDQRTSEVTAKLVLEGEGRTEEGWTVFSRIWNQICTEIDAVLLNTENSSNIEQSVERLLRPSLFARTHLLMILALQETTFWRCR